MVIRTSSRVSAISRVGFDKAKTRGREQAPFEIRYQNGKGPEVLRADAVIDTSGTWFSPNPAGPQWLAGDRRARIRRTVLLMACRMFRGVARSQICWQDRCCLGRGPFRGRHADRSRASRRTRCRGTQPVWLLRGADPAKAFGGGRNDKLAARGELGSAFAALVASGKIKVETEFGVTHLSDSEGRLKIAAGSCCGGRSVCRGRTDRVDRFPSRLLVPV